MPDHKQDVAVQELTPADQIPSLRDTVLPEDGTVTLTYDNAITTPLRVRAADGTKLDDFVHTFAAAVLHSFSSSMAPLELQYLRAQFACGDPNGSSYAVRKLALACIPQVLAWAANARSELDGIPLHIRARLTQPPGAAPGTVDAEFQVAALQSDLVTDVQHRALQALARQGTTLWQSIIARILGPWAVDSGVTEMCCTGWITADSHGEQAGAALSAPILH